MTNAHTGRRRGLRVIRGEGQVVLNDLELGNGIIEFDMHPDQPDFVSLFFRRQNADENEIVYLRTGNTGEPTAPETLQYAPTVKGVVLWNLPGTIKGCSIENVSFALPLKSGDNRNREWSDAGHTLCAATNGSVVSAKSPESSAAIVPISVSCP